jgi:hypothetical protein
MLIVEEFAEGIVQVDHRGRWDDAALDMARHAILSYIETRAETIYVLFNLSATTELDTAAFRRLLTAPEIEQVGLAILVARRSHLRTARDLLSTDPQRDAVQIRLMHTMADAFRTLLDRQAQDRVTAVNVYGR